MMLDAFSHQDGVVYPSWQDNKLVLWTRHLRDMNYAEHWEPLPGIVIKRFVSNTAVVGFEVIEAHKPPKLHKGKNAVRELVEYLMERMNSMSNDSNTIDTPEPTLALSEKAISLLDYLRKADAAVPASKITYHPNLLNALVEKRLIAQEGNKFSITQHGADVLELALTQYGKPDERRNERRVLVLVESKASVPPPEPLASAPLHVADSSPRVLVRTPEPAFSPSGDLALSAEDELLLGGRTGDVQAEDGCTCADCRYRRVLGLLMAINPDIRQAYDQVVALDATLAKVRKVE